MPRRRPDHTGTLTRRRDGRWAGSVMLAGRRYFVYGATRSEAAEKLQALLAQYTLGRLRPPTRLSLADWWGEYLRSRTLRPTTRAGYERAMAPVLQEVGHLRLDKLTPVVLQALFVRLRERHGSRLCQHAYDALRACLNAAVRAELLPRNPLLAVPRPKHTPKERPVWGPAEVQRFLRACETSASRYGPALALLVLTGLRVGELLGLTWNDIDLGAGVLHVRRQLTFVDRRPVEGPPKSRSGLRTIALPERAVRLLQGLPRDGVAVFPQAHPEGLRTTLRRLCARHGLPPVAVHDLRAIHATLLAAAGLEVRAVQHRLGHSDPRLTLKHYTRLLRDSERRAAEALDRALAAGRPVG